MRAMLAPVMLPQTQGRRMSWPSLAVLSCLLLMGPAFLAACSNTPKDLQGAVKKAVNGMDEQIFVEDSPDKYYHPNVIIKRGEAYFEKEEYAEALVEFNRFLEFYRTHVLAPYAAFRLGEVHFKMAKTIDRDPEPMQKAIEAFERVKKEFPGSRYDVQAQEKLEECHNWLAEMHLFVGRFYYRRGSYLAAAHRFEQIMKTYPDRPVAPDALYFLAMSYQEMGADDWASERLEQLVQKYPDSSAASEGKSLLAKLRKGRTSPLLAQQSTSAPSSDVGTATARPQIPDLAPASQLQSLGTPSADVLGQAFTVCRLGAWC